MELIDRIVRDSIYDMRCR